ncbi:hypothetical protein M8542_14260 [Amycolatopsis sp. OK19-0408]|uniref:SD-repeat containing protein B domain-containing protein n=1 Tax=Amycolatopsis iheyensis TaxID=2945988 RepID=A0A9X2SL05_9PSEU|nr:SdrD B-like domain-containing protein [Amycolatopsis iheyensis]MCR6483985.1 hypothetical protein [Amycolatopsis iheyensis]
MSSTPLRGVRRLFAVLAAVLTASALAAPAAHADNSQLVLTASVGAGPQLIGRAFPITLTLTNPTDQPMTKVTLWDEHVSGTWLSIQDWAGLGGSPAAGVDIDAGATRSFTVTAVAYTWNQDVPHEIFHGDWPVAAALTIPMIDPASAHGSTSGVVYGDRNENGAYDAGEGLAGATTYLYGNGSSPIETTTDADGHFAFADLPAMRYGLSTYNLPDGWVYTATAEAHVDIDGSDPGPVTQLRALRPLSEKLHVTGAFEHTTYQVGDPVQVTFTATNVSGEDLHGITIGCDRFGSSQHLIGWTSWADLAAPGFDLAAGQSRTFTETGTAPNATAYGSFYAACDFGIDPGPIDGRPSVDLIAREPAPPGTTHGVIYHDDNRNYTLDPGEAITGTAVDLVDRVDGSVAASAVSDAQGQVSFGPVPAGPYTVRVDGWRPLDPVGTDATVGTCSYCGEAWYLRYQR